MDPLTPRQSRTVERALVVGAAIAVIIVIGWAWASRRFPLTYQIAVIATVQGPSKTNTDVKAAAVANLITAIFSSLHVKPRVDASDHPAVMPNGDPSGSWLRVMVYYLRSSDIQALLNLEEALRHTSPWPITNADERSEFAMVTLPNNVKLWRLRRSLGARGKRIRVHVGLRGPVVVSDISVVLLAMTVLLAVLSFGATERRAQDPFEYPAGMHPFIISSQIVQLALFACLTEGVAAHGGGGVNMGFVILDAIIMFPLVRWLFLSRRHWTTGTLRAAQYVMVSAVLVLGLGALMVGMALF